MQKAFATQRKNCLRSQHWLNSPLYIYIYMKSFQMLCSITVLTSYYFTAIIDFIETPQDLNEFMDKLSKEEAKDALLILLSISIIIIIINYS